ncbi:MAG TPA: hypothetical protein VMB73_23555, partial [Acetobacteraceae bacterium]|nr:hypothetical protein [Acetobacteraceae bacterium]
MLPPSDATTQSAGPAAAPDRRPWRFLLRAVLWLLAAEFASFATAVVIGAGAGISQGLSHSGGAGGWHPDLLFYALVATMTLQATLLYADVKQGRAVGHGNLAIGLGAGPIRR